MFGPPHAICPVCKYVVFAVESCTRCHFHFEAAAPGDPDLAAVIREAKGVLASAAPPGPNDHARSNGERCVRAYFEALVRGNWNVAFDMLSVFARRRYATVPDIPLFEVRQAFVPMTSPRDLKRYWRSIIRRQTFGAHRSVKQVSVLAREGSYDDIETHQVILDVVTRRYARSAAFIGLLGVIGFATLDSSNPADNLRLAFDAAVVKQGSQSWMLTGEFSSAIDRRVGVVVRSVTTRSPPNQTR